MAIKIHIEEYRIPLVVDTVFNSPVDSPLTEHHQKHLLSRHGFA